MTDFSTLPSNAESVENRYYELITLLPDAVFILFEERCVYVNAAGIELFGASSVDFLLGQRLLDAFHNENRELLRLQIAALLSGKRAGRSEQRIVRLDGTLIDVEVAGSLFMYHGQPAVQIIAHDITERKQSIAHLHYLAYYDVLTGLPNMAYFTRTLRQTITEKHTVTVIMGQLDLFTEINSTYGRAVGDQVLKIAAAYLQEVAPAGSLVARTGAYEYGILLFDQTDIPAVQELASRILLQFHAPFMTDANELYLTASLGIARYPADAETADNLVKYADMAKFSIGGTGDAYCLFNREMSDALARKHLIEQQLHKALENEELRVFYQPQVNLATGRTVAAEALVRWQHPELGLLAPFHFIPVAEETGLIEQIDDWVLRKACSDLRACHDAGFPELRVACNMSARQFHRYDLADFVAGTLSAAGLPAQALELEMTETTAMKNVDRTLTTMRKISECGVRIAIDDFGTGYSSLDYLKRFPVNTLKIPRQFVMDMQRNPDNAAIVQAIISLGHLLDLQVLAEGVEHAEELAMIRHHDCDLVQGYYYSKPLPSEAYRAYLSSGK